MTPFARGYASAMTEPAERTERTENIERTEVIQPARIDVGETDADAQTQDEEGR